MKTTYSPSLSTGEDSLPGKRQLTSAGIRRVLINHSTSRRVTVEPCQEPRSGPDAKSSSSTRAPLAELDIGSSEESTEERLAVGRGLEMQGPVVVLTSTAAEQKKNHREESRKQGFLAWRPSGGTVRKLTGESPGTRARQ